MSVLPPKHGNKRGPSFQGVAQMDVVRGVPRARAWPRPRLSKLTPEQRQQNEWFRQAGWAFKYLDPKSQDWFRRATHRTSLYPRDLFSIMASNGLFAISEGQNKVLYPMPFMQAVSQSLDTLSQNPGYMLVRGDQFWEAVPVTAIQSQAFVGCRCQIPADIAANYTTETKVNWTAPSTIDTAGFHSTTVNPSRITSKLTDEVVRLTATVQMNNIASGSSFVVYIRDGSGNIIAYANLASGSGTTAACSLDSGPIKPPVPGTTYYELSVQVVGDTATVLRGAPWIHFSYEVLTSA